MWRDRVVPKWNLKIRREIEWDSRLTIRIFVKWAPQGGTTSCVDRGSWFEEHQSPEPTSQRTKGLIATARTKFTYHCHRIKWKDFPLQTYPQAWRERERRDLSRLSRWRHAAVSQLDVRNNVTWPITSLGSCMILRDQLVRLLMWDPPSDDQDHLQGGPHGHRVTTCTFADYRGCYRRVLCGKAFVYSSFHITMLLWEKDWNDVEWQAGEKRERDGEILTEQGRVKSFMWPHLDA